MQVETPSRTGSAGSFQAFQSASTLGVGPSFDMGCSNLPDQVR
jgi:hypothetical protein